MDSALNLPFAEWTEVLGSERLTGALLDRLTRPRTHPGNERRELPAENEQEEERGSFSSPAGGGRRLWGRLPLRPKRSASGLAGLRSSRPKTEENSPKRPLRSGSLLLRPGGQVGSRVT